MSARVHHFIRACVISPKAKRCASLRTLIESAAIRVAGEFLDAESALAMTEPPNITLIELNPASRFSPESIRQLKANWPQSKVLVLVSHVLESHIMSSFESGADGYLVGIEPTSVLVQAIWDLAQGHAVMSPTVLDRIVAHLRRRGTGIEQAAKLSPRERQILLCLIDGLSYKEMARCFDLSAQTINWHVKRIYQKLKVHSRGQVATMFTTSNLPAQQSSGHVGKQRKGSPLV